VPEELLLYDLNWLKNVRKLKYMYESKKYVQISYQFYQVLICSHELATIAVFCVLFLFKFFFYSYPSLLSQFY